MCGAGCPCPPTQHGRVLRRLPQPLMKGAWGRQGTVWGMLARGRAASARGRAAARAARTVQPSARAEHVTPPASAKEAVGAAEGPGRASASGGLGNCPLNLSVVVIFRPPPKSGDEQVHRLHRYRTTGLPVPAPVTCKAYSRSTRLPPPPKPENVHDCLESTVHGHTGFTTGRSRCRYNERLLRAPTGPGTHLHPTHPIGSTSSSSSSSSSSCTMVPINSPSPAPRVANSSSPTLSSSPPSPPSPLTARPSIISDTSVW